MNHSQAFRSILAFILSILCQFGSDELLGTDAANILISPSWINPVHRFTMRELAGELIKRGHTITWFEYGLMKRDDIPLPSAVNEVFVITEPAHGSSIRDMYQYRNHSSYKRIWEENFWNSGEQTSGWLASIHLCELLLSSVHRSTFNKLVDQHFDAIVIDDLYNPCGLLLTGLKRSPPFVYWSMTGLRTESAWANQSPSPPSYIPVSGTGLTDDMSYWQRAYNLGAYLQKLYIHQHIILRRMDALFKKYYPDRLPEAFYLERNASINFVNHPPIFDFARPYMPRVNFVGGLHCRKPLELTPMNSKLQAFVDGSSEDKGFILITSGFSRHWNAAPEETIINLLGAIHAQPDKMFVWQYDGPPLKNQPKNLYTGKWLPQQSLLAHPKCRAHISHGGLNSVIESVWHGVPIIGWPLSSGEYDNLLRVTARQAGIMLDTKRPTEKQLISAITRIYIKFYKEEILFFQDLLRDVPYTELNHSAFWVEFIVRHQEVPHARSGADDLNFLQYFLVDVIAFVLAVAIATLYVIYIGLKLMFRAMVYLIQLPFKRYAYSDQLSKTKKKTN